MKEQQNEAMKQTLKNGLFNGLKFSSTMDLLQGDNRFNIYWTIDGVVKLFGDYCVNTLENSDAYPIKTVTPHLFPLSHLTKEIVIEGYNDNKPFVPVLLLFDKFVKMGCMDHDDHNDQVDGILFMIEQHIDEVPVKWVIELNKMKFNTEGLKPDQFIDASKSKVYQPKK